jgi:RNA-binding protein YhbY
MNEEIMENLEKGLSREEIVKRVKVMIVGANPDFTKEVVDQIANETADQYLDERDNGAELLDI